MKNPLPQGRRFVAQFVGLAALGFALASLTSLPGCSWAAESGQATHHHLQVNAVVHWNGVADEAFAPSRGTNPRLTVLSEPPCATKPAAKAGASPPPSV